MSDVKYDYNFVQFKNGKVASDRLADEIRSSLITISLNCINTYNNVASIFFKATLTVDDKTLLDTIVANHSGEPLPEETQIVRAEILTEHLKYVEAGDVTQTLFACESIVLDIASGDTTKIIDVSWKYNISLKSGTLPVSNDMVGDEVVVEVGSNTLIGAVALPVNIGDDTITRWEDVERIILNPEFDGLYVDIRVYDEIHPERGFVTTKTIKL